MIKVTFTDGQVSQYETIKKAKDGILETVFVCEFAVAVDRIEKDGKELSFDWDIRIFE